jgi:hypothetical protein
MKEKSIMTGGISMLYPIISYEDGTEVTASKPDNSGRITVYTEKFDAEKDDFIFAEIIIPDITVKSCKGYNEKELNNLLKEYSEIKDDIIEYVMDRVKQSH